MFHVFLFEKIRSKMLIFFPDLSSLEKFEKRYGSVLKKDEKNKKTSIHDYSI